MKEKLNLLNDYLFMKYMGEKGDEEQLTAFLNAVLQRTGKGEISSVNIIENKALAAEILGGKTCVLDLRAVLADGAKVNIEVQLADQGNMEHRGLYYWSREFVGGINSGQNYAELPEVIAVNIIDFEFMPAIDEIQTSFHLWEDRHKDKMLTDALEMHFINMFKFRRIKEPDIINNPLHRWLAFFSKETDESTMKQIIDMDKAIEKAHKKVVFVSCDAEALHVYHMRELAEMDRVCGVNYARREGITIGKREGITIGEQRGIALGEQKALSEYIIKLSQKGKSTKEISELIDLPLEEVNRILNNELTIRS